MKKIMSLVLAALLLCTTCLPASAAQTVEEYVEEMYQINFTDINVSVDENGRLSVKVKDNLSSARNSMAENNIVKLQEVIQEFPCVESDMLTMMEETDGELCAISITEVPLIWNGDHYERMSANTRGQTSSESNGNGKFLMYTMVGGCYSNDEDAYVVMTCGSWSANSFLGGQNYPAAGEDYVLQSCPNSFVRIEDELTVTYNNAPVEGTEGENFWREDGNEYFVQYALEDDPFGTRQCKSFVLTTGAYGPASDGEYRQINSYYVHTWKALTIETSFGVNTEKEVSVDITPSIVNKSWQVYNYVTFNF